MIARHGVTSEVRAYVFNRVDVLVHEDAGPGRWYILAPYGVLMRHGVSCDTVALFLRTSAGVDLTRNVARLPLVQIAPSANCPGVGIIMVRPSHISAFQFR